MRKTMVLVASLLGSAALVGSASRASAEPAPSTSATSATSATNATSATAELPARAFVGGVGSVGLGEGGLYSQAGVEGGYRLGARPLYLHGELALGHMDDLSEVAGGSDNLVYGSAWYAQIRAGVETRLCSARDQLCGLAGADLGVLKTGSTTGPRTDSMTTSFVDYQVIPRLGVELGGKVVRVRLTAELPVGDTVRADGASHAGVQGLMWNAGVVVRL